MSKSPVVSIIMPSYNSAKTISSSIQSVLNQTEPNWELLIIDDNSADDTLEIIKPFVIDKRIKLTILKKNEGAANARNIGLQLAKGEWIAFLDSDDLWKKDKLEKQLSFMNKNNYSFSCTKYEKKKENSSMVVLVSAPRKIRNFKMHLACFPGCLTVMYKRDPFNPLQVDTRILKRNDYALWLQLSKTRTCYYLDENLATYNNLDNSLSSGKKLKLIKHHYKLFRINCNYGIIKSLFYTLCNIVFSTTKKLIYEKRMNR